MIIILNHLLTLFAISPGDHHPDLALFYEVERLTVFSLGGDYDDNYASDDDDDDNEDFGDDIDEQPQPV